MSGNPGLFRLKDDPVEMREGAGGRSADIEDNVCALGRCETELEGACPSDLRGGSGSREGKKLSGGVVLGGEGSGIDGGCEGPSRKADLVARVGDAGPRSVDL